MQSEWTAENVLELARGYQPTCVLAAAAELDVFRVLAGDPKSAADVAYKLGTDLRATTTLLDALAALDLVDKRDERYFVPSSTARLLAQAGPGSVLAMVQHHANCMRRWVRLAEVVQTGRPVERRPSIRGEAGDEAAFIGAMEVVSAPVAAGIIDELGPPDFSHLLDVGGASGSWTTAFLRANPRATATLFDLPHVIPMAEQRLSEARMNDRVKLVAGDFLADPLPTGADLAWVSAIVHQNSREQNRHLFSSVANVLEEDGHILIRDVLMDRSRTLPVNGALFAINMLVATEGGGTFTFDELREDLEASGFIDVDLARRDEWMNSIVRAAKRPKV
jgi:precorrin-6B methylase 2